MRDNRSYNFIQYSLAKIQVYAAVAPLRMPAGEANAAGKLYERDTYLEELFTQIYRVLYGEAMLVSIRGEPMCVIGLCCESKK